MTYPFVAASAQFGPRKGPVKAFIVHHAEGGGTVGFLSRPNPRNVSVHYVIQYTGRIVQMVKESDASGSINPNDLRTTDDPTTFGATVRKSVMGEWDRDPNSAAITLELEGFAATGPNKAQQAALTALVNDVRSRYPDMGLLGHRDFADYKACPGKLIPWAAIGGHGPAQGGTDVRFANSNGYDVTSAKRLALPAGQPWTYLDGSTGGTFSAAATVECLGIADATSGQYVIEIGTGAPYNDKVARRTLVMVKTAATPTDVPPPAIDCTQAVADAKAAEHERVRSAAIAAVGAIK